jgi:hypothetical protein
MKYLFLTFLLLSCTHLPSTTEHLLGDAADACTDSWGNRDRSCEFRYVVRACKEDLLDLRICGKLEQ